MGWFNNMKVKYLFEDGCRHFEKKEFAKALTIFIDVIKKSPQDNNILGAALYYSGLIFMGSRDYDSAKLAYARLEQMGGIHKQRANELMESIQKAKAYDNDNSNDEWVFIGNNDSIADYYDSTSVIISKDFPPCITVTCKRVYNDKGKKILFDYRKLQGLNNNEIRDIHHSLNGYNLYYEERKKTLLVTTHVSKSGDILETINMLESGSIPTIDDIKPGTVDDMILNKIVKDYKL